MNFMKQLWWIGAVVSVVLIRIIRFTDWRLIPCAPCLGQNANIAIEALSFSYLASAIFFLLNDYVPQFKKQDIYVRHVKRQVSIVKEYMRQIVNSIKPFEINKDYEDKAFIDAFVNTDLLNLDPHMKRFLLCSEMPNRRSTPVGTNIPFPDDLRRNRKRSHEETLLYQHLGTLFRSLSLFMKLAV